MDIDKVRERCTIVILVVAVIVFFAAYGAHNKIEWLQWMLDTPFK